MLKENILTPQNASEWRTPIFPVRKSNNKIWVCGDVKMTVNLNLEIQWYPIPNIEDIFATLQKGEI